jgi:multidrug efflux pump
MAARGLTVQDVETAIRTENAEIPGGRVEGEQREFAVRTRGELIRPRNSAPSSSPSVATTWCA